jgi:4-carboxymuconolactone decarboxylase
VQKIFGDVAPALADYSEKVLFGDLWERPILSPLLYAGSFPT